MGLINHTDNVGKTP